MPSMLHWTIACAALVSLSSPSAATVPPSGKSCDSRSWYNSCTFSRLHKPLRIFDSFHYLLRGTPKNNGDENGRDLQPEPSNIAPKTLPPIHTTQRIDGVRTHAPTMPRPTVEPDPEMSIMMKNLQRLENEQCGESEMNIKEEETWTEPGEFPWLALLHYESNDPSFSELEILCGGSLITDRYVLTSAYCLTSQTGYKLSFVRLGEYNLDYFEKDCTDLDLQIFDIIAIEACHGVLPKDYDISEVIPHPKYVYDDELVFFSHDIGLVRLAEQVKFTDFIKPICLPVGNLKTAWSSTNFGLGLTVAGWGDNVVPRRSIMPLKDFCNEILNETLSEGQLCVGDDSEDNLCFGDFGGPLVTSIILGSPDDGSGWVKQMKSIQVGVMSSTFCIDNMPLVFTSVETYLPWILRTMKP